MTNIVNVARTLSQVNFINEVLTAAFGSRIHMIAEWGKEMIEFGFSSVCCFFHMDVVVMMFATVLSVDCVYPIVVVY